MDDSAWKLDCSQNVSDPLSWSEVAAQNKGKKWFSMSEEEDSENNKTGTTSAPSSDDGMEGVRSDAAPPRPNVLRPKVTDLDDRFAQLDLQRQDMERETAEITNAANNRDQKHQADMDKMFETITSIQNMIKDNQRLSEDRMKKVEDRAMAADKLANERFSQLLAAMGGKKPAPEDDDDDRRSDRDGAHDTADRAKRSPRRTNAA